MPEDVRPGKARSVLVVTFAAHIPTIHRCSSIAPRATVAISRELSEHEARTVEAAATGTHPEANRDPKSCRFGAFRLYYTKRIKAIFGDE